jgi:hypothetical protein
MRDLDTIDSELRLIAAVRRTIHEQGVEPSSRQGRRIVERATPASVQGTTMFGDSRLRASVLAVWQAVTDSIQYRAPVSLQLRVYI